MGCQYAAKLSQTEEAGLLVGRLPSGTTIPMFDYETFLGTSMLPKRYGVKLPFDVAKKSSRGYVNLSLLRDDPLFVVSVGGLSNAKAYLDKIATRSSTVGNWPPFSEIFWDQAQARLLFIDTDGGILGTNGMVNAGRYVVLRPTNSSSCLCALDF